MHLPGARIVVILAAAAALLIPGASMSQAAPTPHPSSTTTTDGSICSPHSERKRVFTGDRANDDIILYRRDIQGGKTTVRWQTGQSGWTFLGSKSSWRVTGVALTDGTDSWLVDPSTVPSVSGWQSYATLRPVTAVEFCLVPDASWTDRHWGLLTGLGLAGGVVFFFYLRRRHGRNSSN